MGHPPIEKGALGFSEQEATVFHPPRLCTFRIVEDALMEVMALDLLF
jgi:hypothetical protein